MPRQARQYGTIEEDERARARIRTGIIPVRPVAAPAFARHVHGQP